MIEVNVNGALFVLFATNTLGFLIGYMAGRLDGRNATRHEANQEKGHEG